MASATLYLSPLTFIVQYLTNAGVIAAGASVQTNLAGTVSTLQTTYQDSTGLVPNANPMTLNASGRAATQQGALAAFWVTSGVSIDAIFTDTLGETWAIRNIPAINDPAGAGSLQTLLASAAQSNSAGSGPVAGVDLVANGIKSFDVFADVRAANTPVLVSGQTLSIQVQGAASINDGLGGDFYWNATSVLADNNATVIRPTSASGAGRWLRLGTPPFGAYGTIAAGTTTDLGTVGPNLVQITGTGPITSFGSSATTARAFYVVTFTGACTLTYNAVSMLTPGAQNVVTGVGDTALLQYLGSGNWNVIALLRAFASPPGEMMLVTTADQPLTSSLTFNNIVGLGVTPLPIGSYQVSLRLMLQGTGGTAQGYKIQLTAAGTVTGLSLGTGVASSNGTPTAQLVAINAPLVQAAISSTTGDMVSLDFILVVSTAQALNAQFTQNASSANATTVKAGSLMAIKRIA